LINNSINKSRGTTGGRFDAAGRLRRWSPRDVAALSGAHLGPRNIKPSIGPPGRLAGGRRARDGRAGEGGALEDGGGGHGEADPRRAPWAAEY
jgi:hypothetical protein